MRALQNSQGGPSIVHVTLAFLGSAFPGFLPIDAQEFAVFHDETLPALKCVTEVPNEPGSCSLTRLLSLEGVRLTLDPSICVEEDEENPLKHW